MSTEPKSRNAPRVVIDTNVIVSGLNTPRGNEFQILLRGVRGEIQVYLSSFILSEVERVLQTKFGWQPSRVEDAVADIYQWAMVVEPTSRVTVIQRKDSDNRILECCLECEAQYLITGDQRDLLPLQTFQGTRIMNAASFLRELANLESIS
jgi:putative PIN family toxin of toxin-antitoxin system